MAINKNNSLSGIVGPVVVYKLNGQDIMRARPRRFKQTKATRAAAKQFGLASTISAKLRQQIYKSLEGITQQSMRYRFNKAIQEWLRNGKPGRGSAIGFSPLEQFQFNEKTSLGEKLKAQVSIDWTRAGKVILNIPVMVPIRDIAAPPTTESIQWILEVSSISLDSPGSTRNDRIDLDIKYTDKSLNAQTHERRFPLKPGELTIVVLALKYTVNKNGDKKILNDEKWLPAGVIGSYYKDKS